MTNTLTFVFILSMICSQAFTKSLEKSKAKSARILYPAQKNTDSSLYKFLTKDSSGNWYINLQEENYSGYKVPARLPWAKTDTDVKTFWKKLRFDPETMLVHTGDFTYTTSTGYCSHHQVNQDRIPYASAFDCENDGSATGRARVDLTGTNFALDDSFASDGWNPNGSVTITGQTADIYGGGYCGWTAPNNAKNENEAVLGGFHLKLRLIPDAIKYKCVVTAA